jgi:HTH-type transcriptional regulator/antitoxin HigA
MMKASPIRNEDDYKATLERIEQLMDAKAGTVESDELEVLSLLVEAWEETHYPIDDPDPIEYLKNVMEFKGLGQKDLAELLNSRPRASEILNRQRLPNLTMVRKISHAWQVPADPLIGEYHLAIRTSNSLHL